jgi:hypothetical protein
MAHENNLTPKRNEEIQHYLGLFNKKTGRPWRWFPLPAPGDRNVTVV